MYINQKWMTSTITSNILLLMTKTNNAKIYPYQVISDNAALLLLHLCRHYSSTNSTQRSCTSSTITSNATNMVMDTSTTTSTIRWNKYNHILSFSSTSSSLSYAEERWYQNYDRLKQYVMEHKQQQQLQQQQEQQQQQGQLSNTTTKNSTTNSTTGSSSTNDQNPTPAGDEHYNYFADDIDDDYRPPYPKDESLRNWLDIQRNLYQQQFTIATDQENDSSSNSRTLSNSTTTVSSLSAAITTTTSTLSEEKIDLLLSLGYSLNPRDDFWESKYQQLCDFKQQHYGLFPYQYDLEELIYTTTTTSNNNNTSSNDNNNSNNGNDTTTTSNDMNENSADSTQLKIVSWEEKKKITSIRDLYWWCKRQKLQYHRYKKGFGQTNMTPYRESKLNAIGFCWDQHDMAWKEKYQELVEYKQNFGDCHIPMIYEANPSLATWVSDQRTQYKRMMTRKQYSSMTKQRIQLLNEIGFIWNVHDIQWRMKYLEFVQHVTYNGYGSTPTRKQNPNLYYWLNRQRTYYRQQQQQQPPGELESNKVHKDDDDDFDDSTNNFDSDEDSNGTRSIMNDEISMKKKSIIITKTKKVNSLTQERIQLLDQLGFPWYLTNRPTSSSLYTKITSTNITNSMNPSTTTSSSNSSSSSSNITSTTTITKRGRRKKESQ